VRHAYLLTCLFVFRLLAERFQVSWGSVVHVVRLAAVILGCSICQGVQTVAAAACADMFAKKSLAPVCCAVYPCKSIIWDPWLSHSLPAWCDRRYKYVLISDQPKFGWLHVQESNGHVMQCTSVALDCCVSINQQLSGRAAVVHGVLIFLVS
jgi:hypothetical protein